MKKKLPLRYFAVIICTLLLLVQPGVSQAGSVSQKIENNKSQYSDLNIQKESTQSKIKEIRTKSRTVQEQLVAVNLTLDKQSNEINEKEAAIGQLQNEIVEKETNIKSAEEQLQGERDQFNKIVVNDYQDGPSSYLDVLFGAQNFSDFLNRLSYLKLIMSYENGVIQTVAANEAKLVSEKEELHSRQEADKNSLMALNSLKAQQHAAQQQQQNILLSLKQQENQEVAELNAENRAMQELSAQISALEKQYAGSDNSQGTTTAGGWVWPVPSSHTISSGYGNRTIFGQSEFHNGLDIAAPLGTPIVAAASGVVLYAGPASGFGHWIVIMHSQHLLSVYGHMYASGILVHPGEKVTAGQQIAKVGSDGQATGPHLHFSVCTGFDSQGYMITVNPSNYL